ncbi:MAG: GSCFA domain-containing protein [bacterium]|nr:GSCFA domain-containing protein [bacterium]
MKLQLDFELPRSSSKLKHGDSVVLLGSCFSDNLAPKFEASGFRVCSNPLGTIFHPSALSAGIRSAFNDFESKAISREDLWFDWRASGTVYGTSKEDLDQKMEKHLVDLKQELLSAKMLVVTFGTSWGYEFEAGEIVANCHKLSQDSFTKKLSPLEELISNWEETIQLLSEVNPELQLVFTVSPVRHSKDGLIENNRSKARLIQLCESLSAHGDYFPSYELVIDVLRDHRFFDADLVHPNAQAIDFIWEHAQSFFFAFETREIAKEVASVNQMLMHESLHPESRAAKDFVEKTQKKKDALSSRFPGVYWKTTS